MENIERKKIKRWIAFFIIMVFLNGLTAMPVDTELEALLKVIPHDSLIYIWIEKVLAAYRTVNSRYTFLLYGYDWLAFAHFTLSILFIGPYRNPVKNIWVIEFGMIACVLVIPFALVGGYCRQIPIGWQLIDCCFGVFGYIPLKIIHKKITVLIKGQPLK